MTDKEKVIKIHRIQRKMKLIQLERDFKPNEKQKFINRIINLIWWDQDSDEDADVIEARIRKENTDATTGVPSYTFKRGFGDSF